MKRILTITLAVFLLLTAAVLFGCGKSGEPTPDGSAPSDSELPEVPISNGTPDTESLADEDDYEFNPRLESAWRKDDHTVVFAFDGFVSRSSAVTDIRENIYIASAADGDPIAYPQAFFTYNGDLSKTYEVVFDGTLPAAGSFYLVIRELSGSGDADLNTVFVDYADCGVYGNIRKGSEYVAAVAVTDEVITATKMLYMEWCRLVGENVVAVKYSEPVTVDASKVNDYGHVAHIAPLSEGQLIVNAAPDILKAFPGAEASIVQRHTRYFIAYEKDPSVVLFIFSSDYGPETGCLEDTADIDARAWVEGAAELGFDIILREYPYECIASAETGKQCTITRDVPITDTDFTVVDVTGISGAIPGRN
jgi:hypothetical protein